MWIRHSWWQLFCTESLQVEIYVAIVVICFLGHPVEMLPVLAAAFVSVLLTVQFFCVYKWVKQLSGEKPMVDGAIHECMDGHMSVFTPCIHNIQGVCINTCSKYPCRPMFLLYWFIIVDVCNIHQLPCLICNALKKITAHDIIAVYR